MVYEGDTFQIFVALCIFANFIAQAVESQVLPKPRHLSLRDSVTDRY